MKYPPLRQVGHLLCAVLLLMTSFNLSAQNISTDPGAYMTAVTTSETDMNQTYLAYMSAVAHSGRAKKVERMREKVIKSIVNCKSKIAALPDFKGDNSLKKSTMDYVDLCYKIFNEDYSHIVNMESLIEQTYDEMQLYLLTMEKTNEKLQDAITGIDSAGKEFAKKYNVTIINENDNMSKEMEITSDVLHYRNKLYLLFFKCNWQDGQITQAINDKKLTGLEQARNALDTYAKEGLLAVDSLNNFKGDHALAEACTNALHFYQNLTENELPEISDFFLKEENFNKLKQAYAAKPRSSLTKQDVETYNKAVNDYNSEINAYNQLNTKINNERIQNLQNWNNHDKWFMDAQIPHM